jgi:hypothetical protein
MSIEAPRHEQDVVHSAVERQECRQRFFIGGQSAVAKMCLNDRCSLDTKMPQRPSALECTLLGQHVRRPAKGARMTRFAIGCRYDQDLAPARGQACEQTSRA